MGYTTTFTGRFELSRPLTVEEHIAWTAFADADHRDSMPSGIRYGYYCDWKPTKDGKFVEWNNSEKFYSYTQWLQYVIDTFVIPTGNTLNGDVTWRGEEPSDLGCLSVTDNVLTVKQGRIVYE